MGGRLDKTGATPDAGQETRLGANREGKGRIRTSVLTSPCLGKARRRQSRFQTGPGSAVKLVDGLAGASPASAGYPVGTVVISGDGAGDQTVESPEVNALVGWVQIRSAPTGGLAKQQVVAQANRS
jgi:hypothetical protein